MTAPVLELDAITKRFGAITANQDVSLSLGRGEVLALLGENGAGKTTLMNILFGHYTPDQGEVRVHGRPLPPGRPRAAIEAGVGMVHQHFALAGNLSVLDNIIIGSEPLWRPRSARAKARARIAEIADRFGLAADPDALISDLSVGERQRVEILKALYRDAEILILDEPTAVLTRPEADHLFETLRGMTAGGLSVIFISHKLHEVMAASDRVVILRGGKAVAERRTADTRREELAELMVGRRVQRPRRTRATPGPVLLEGQDLTLDADGVRTLDHASFHVRANEVLGIVGVSGNGQAVLGRILSGQTQPTGGTLHLKGETVRRAHPRRFVAAGIGRIPEDRHADGVVGEMALWENAILERVRTPAFSRRALVQGQAARRHTADLIERFDIRGATPDTRTRLLSGGNMQKLILGRNLIAAPDVIIANQPTRGLDEGAIAAVHTELLAARDAGAAVVLISEDLDEVLGLADRIQAIVKGRLSAPLDGDEADGQTVGLLMAGIWETADAT